MRKCHILAMILAIALVARASDFWVSREPGQWSDDEIRRMVTDSPWAKEASVNMRDNPRAVPGTGQTGPRSGVSRSDSDSAIANDTYGGEGARRMGSGLAGTGEEVAPPRIIVRWESAVPVCEACAHGGLERYLFSCASKLLYLSGLSRKFAELAREFYVISMSNYPQPFAGAAPQHSPAATAALESMGQRIQRATFIRVKGRNPIRPAHAAVVPAGKMLLLMMFFPRTDPLTFNDREVLFESIDERVEVRSKFNLRKMAYKGRLDL